MKKCQCIYKYTKEPQSTETHETDSDSDTKKQDGQNNIFFFCFFFLTGVICVGVKPQRHEQLAKPPCSGPHENYSAVGKCKLRIQADTVDFLARLELYVGTSHPKIRHAVKPPCKILQKFKMLHRIKHTKKRCLNHWKVFNN